jgi:UDP-glucose 4-epimerase
VPFTTWVTARAIQFEKSSDKRPGDPAILIASSEKIKKELGWKPRYEDLETIIRTAWVWHRKEANLSA